MWFLDKTTRIFSNRPNKSMYWGQHEIIHNRKNLPDHLIVSQTKMEGTTIPVVNALDQNVFDTKYYIKIDF